MRGVVFLLAISLAVPAWAHEKPKVQEAQAPGHTPDHNALDCYCRAQGRIFAPGEHVCLRTANGPRLAQCRMEINVMSWSFTETPCPET
ncbi:MAG TPA: hypothetical protein VEZ16_13610 [Microvirga sp.]|nr:hypothetical protein [Microvirga sp.]